MTATPSAEAHAIAGQLGALLDGSGTRDELDEVWESLRTGGWLEVGDVSQHTDPSGRLVDVIPVAEVWGSRRVPLPYLETLAWTLAGLDPQPVCLRDDSGWLLPHPEPAADDETVTTVDRFCEAVPVGRADSAVPLKTPPDEVRRALVVLWAASATGSAAAALDRTLEHVRTREAYGQPVGAFQAVQHLAANMHVDLELARSGAVAAAQNGGEPRGLRATMARCRSVVDTAIQLHGGIGFTWELGLHHDLRHTIVLERLVGAAGTTEPA